MMKYLIEVFSTRISSDDRLIMILLLGRVMTRAVSSHSNYLLCHNDDGQLHITLDSTSIYDAMQLSALFLSQITDVCR